jgi:hypothetical protein
MLYSLPNTLNRKGRSRKGPERNAFDEAASQIEKAERVGLRLTPFFD